MAILNSQPMQFCPGMGGLVDAFDSTKKFPGACTQLANLIHDQVNPEFVVSRPGNLILADFVAAGFNTPTFISVQVAAGNHIFGMVTTQRNPGFDEPFFYSTTTGLFVTVGTVTGANTPASQLTNGVDWTPPTLAIVGTMVVITHPGFTIALNNGYYGIIDITSITAPVWRSENTTTNQLLSIPVAVANFNNRAWFAGSANTTGGTASYSNWVWYTDILTNPLTMTNASQALVIGDTSNINALAGLPNQTTSSGIIQSLTVFKQTQIWQITGDTTQANLSLNYLSLNIGTLMPRSIVQVPFGLYFISSGGPYMINLLGAVLPLVNGQSDTEPDIQVPFQNAVTPTRWCAAYNSQIYRVCGPTVINGVQSVNDYWFDEHKRRWNGPHSFAYDCASASGTLFVLSSYLQPGKLIQSSPVPSSGFPNTDLGKSITFTLQSSTFPKVGDMLTKMVCESQGEFASINGSQVFNLIASDERGRSIGNATINTGVAVPIWGNPALLWGTPPVGTGSLWTQSIQQYIPFTYPIPWAAPLVFEKMQLGITGTIASNLGIGTFMARYQKTGYMTTGNP